MSIAVGGLRELDQALGTLRKATAAAVLRRVLLKHAEAIAADARTLAPYDPRNVGSHLRDTIVATLRPPRGEDAGLAAFSGTLRTGGTRAEAVQNLRDARRGAGLSLTARVWVGPNRHPKAITQEFGTWFHPPQPYLRPAWERNRAAVLAAISRDLKVEIEKTVARVAKRKAKG